MSDNASSPPPYPDSDRGYLAHWNRVGVLLDDVRRREARAHGPKPYDGQMIDSLLQLGFLHGNRNPPTGLIEWQARLAAAYKKHDPTLFDGEHDQ